MTGRKRLLLTVLSLFLAVIFTQSVFASGETRVFDNAGLFTNSEKQRMETEIAEFKETYEVDMVILTTADAEGKNPQEFADDFYDNNGLGMGTDYSGVLFLIDMDNREICLSTSAKGARVLTDQRVESVLDAAYDKLALEDYSGSAMSAIQTIAGYMQQGIPSNQYSYIKKERSLTLAEIITALILSAVIAALPCVTTINRYKMKQEHRQAANYRMAYRAGCSFRFVRDDEKFINKSVIRQRISSGTGTRGSGRGSSGRTTMHRSSSGRMHGGGRRKF